MYPWPSHDYYPWCDSRPTCLAKDFGLSSLDPELEVGSAVAVILLRHSIGWSPTSHAVQKRNSHFPFRRDQDGLYQLACDDPYFAKFVISRQWRIQCICFSLEPKVLRILIIVEVNGKCCISVSLIKKRSLKWSKNEICLTQVKFSPGSFPSPTPVLPLISCLLSTALSNEDVKDEKWCLLLTTCCLISSVQVLLQSSASRKAQKKKKKKVRFKLHDFVWILTRHTLLLSSRWWL